MNYPNKNKFIGTLLLISMALLACSNATATSTNLTAVYVSGDGRIITNTISGTSVVQTKPTIHYIYYNVPDGFSHGTNTPLYVHVIYYDTGAGFIQMQYDAVGDSYKQTETHLRSTRVNMGHFVDSYHELLHPVLGGHENDSSDLRLYINDTNTVLSVASVVIQDEPFADEQFQLALSKPWLSAYTGLTRTDVVDASSMTDKVMCGYQGWFHTPNDLDDGGWLHWCRNGIMDTNHFNTDMWPDMSQYPSSSYIQAGNVKTKSGQPAYVFSDSDPDVVEVQFQWMRKYNIDGVFLQRFLKPSGPISKGNPNQEWTLANVRAAANAEGRIWAIEYDASSLSNANAYSALTNDWMWMVNTFKIKEDSRYAHNGTKPVVGFFGLGDPKRNDISAATTDKILNWFKNDPTYGGNYIWGAPPTDWLTQWVTYSNNYKKYDAISPWHSSDYGKDIAKANTWGAAYWPILWPGFSWSNEQHTNSNNGAFKDRNGGTFFWTKAHSAMTNASVNCLFIGMFDEYDEGTAIMPMSDDPPKSPCGTYGGAFIDNEGKPSDWWLALAGEARAEMFKQRTNSLTLPTTLELTNRSNIGPEVDDALQASDSENGLYRVPVSLDGNTSVETKAGKSCRYNTTPASDHYFYFDVDDNFRYQAVGRPDSDITIEVEYYDAGGSVPFTLEYSSTNGSAYASHSKTVTTQGTGRWRNARFEVDDAYFGNDENDGADFRVHALNSEKLDISRVWVRKDELKYRVWNIDEIGSGAAGDGTIDELNDKYIIDGAGSDIYGTADSFVFCDQTLSGNGQIVARVNSLDNTAPAAKAGVMIRSSLSNNAPTVAVVVTPSNAPPSKGIFYLVRSTTGGSIVQTTITNLVAPYWVKVTRTNDVFNGYCSPDGINWTLIGTDTVSMPTTVFMGLGVTSKDVDTLNTAIFQNVSVSGDPFYDDGL